MWDRSQLDFLCVLKSIRRKEFPTSGEDEFIIVRENGQRQGIFKEWVMPVLPPLAGLRKEEWIVKAKDPLFLRSELENALSSSRQLDRVMTTTTFPEMLSNHVSKIADPRYLAVLLANQLEYAFRMMAPFYHLEAIVDDPAWLGIDVENSSPATGGELDIAAFLLPSALGQYVVASSGNWNGLDWQTLQSLATEAIKTHDEVLSWMGNTLGEGVSSEHILFAVNALEFIPRRVGGKKGDLSAREAVRELKNLIRGSRQPTDCLSIFADVNARIRFFNWLPLVEGPENFQGRGWTYASVCDTADDLFQLLDQHPELWRQTEFQKAYQELLRPQLLNLDATSARGRFLLDLIINERRI